ncbi:MAG: methylmalonyl-CoA mutase, partial [Calditrichaeota bacterium]|nr:methylmalonyl-CoA mutase [Calditrichota bacterium]
EMPVYGTIASQFNDPGTNSFYRALIDRLVEKLGLDWESIYQISKELSEKQYIIPPERVRYLAEIAEISDRYNRYVQKQTDLARQAYQLRGTIDLLKAKGRDAEELETFFKEVKREMDKDCQDVLDTWEAKKQSYRDPQFVYKVRNKEIRVDNFSESLSHQQIP